jgi:hypothetical protein
MATKWLVFQAILFELGGIAGLFSGLPLWSQLLTYVLAHAVSSGILTLIFWRFLPKRYQLPLIGSMSFLFITQFSLPFVGSLGMLGGLMLPLWLPRKRENTYWYEMNDPDLPYKPVEVSSQPLYSQGGLKQVLREAISTEKRIKAVMATKQMSNRDAIGILQEALKDSSDDVRLLAYAMLDEKEKVISNEIKQCQAELANSTKQRDQIAQYKLLAMHYWEMAYLGLAQGGVKIHFMQQARESCEKVLSVEQAPDILRLMGRIAIHSGQPEEAKQAFLSAIEQGLPRRQILSYLAEIAWMQRQFGEVKMLLTEYALSGEQIHPAFESVMHYWVDKLTLQRRAQ